MKIICIIELNKFLVLIPLYFRVANKLNTSVIVLKSIFYLVPVQKYMYYTIIVHSHFYDLHTEQPGLFGLLKTAIFH